MDRSCENGPKGLVPASFSSRTYPSSLWSIPSSQRFPDIIRAETKPSLHPILVQTTIQYSAIPI
jgi:hypothetical protein